MVSGSLGPAPPPRDDGRGRWLLSGVIVYLAILGVVAGGLAYLYRAAQARLDDALGQRLASVAVTAAYLVEGDSLRAWSLEPSESLAFLWMRSRLEQVRLDNNLAEVVLCDPDGRVIVSAARRLEQGETNVFWSLDGAAVSVAKQGFASTSRLYRSGTIYQKSAHAPVLTADGAVAGILSVEADADFLDSLAALRRGALATGAAVLVFLTLMGALLFKLHSALEAYRAAVWRQENLAAMGRMTAAIAHEIRNPLGIIRGAAQHLGARLREAGLAPDEISDFIPAEVDRLDRILKGYLAFGTGAPVEVEPVDLSSLARRTARLLERELGESGVRVDITDDGVPPIPGDPRRLQQVLLNLLLNARDAMPAGGTVAVTVRREGDGVVLAVTDEGSGLGGQSDAQLFAPFRSTKEKGSGLGLAVVRQIIEAHGGAVTLRERPDRSGAVAEVNLPLAERRGASRVPGRIS